MKTPKEPANSQKTAKRAATSASFKPGVSGNLSGRPKKTTEEFELIAACQEKTLAALEVMEKIMIGGENERNKLAAALAIIERGHGKPIDRKEVRTGMIDDLSPEALDRFIDRKAKEAGVKIH